MFFKGTKIAILLALITPLLHSNAQAADATSAYSKIDWDKDCKRIDTPPVDEPDLGGHFKCAGYQDYPIWISTGDLRESVQFGHLNHQITTQSSWESFSSFNQINLTIEWRLKKGRPIAAIYRHFIDNGEGNATSRKQFLVIKSVASLDTGGIGCVYGMVNGRENKANETARRVADGMSNPLSKCENGAPVDLYTAAKAAPFYVLKSQAKTMSRHFPDPIK
ncbi:MAG: hypothetical protein ABJO30_09155 [Hyphomicrobiales bacterium]